MLEISRRAHRCDTRQRLQTNTDVNVSPTQTQSRFMLTKRHTDLCISRAGETTTTTATHTQ